MAKCASFFSNSFGLFKQTFPEWLEDKAPQLGETIGVSQQILTELRSVAVTAAMARAIRIEYEGAFYHVMARPGKQTGARPNSESFRERAV